MTRPPRWLRGARRSAGVVLLVAASLLPRSLAQGAYLDPPRAEAGLATFAAQVAIDRAAGAGGASGGTASPHGGRWFVARAPSFAVDPPWTTIVEVGGRAATPWRLTLRDHANADVRVLWVSEQLLFVEVWWGRTVSSELLFDAHRAELVHATTYAWYGAVDDAP